MLLKLRLGGLRGRIMAWSFVPTAIILAIVAGVAFMAYQSVTEDLVIERNQELARLSAGQLSSGLADYSGILENLARTSGILQSNPSRQAEALRLAANSLAVFDGGAAIIDNLGWVVAGQPERPDLHGQNWSKLPFFRQIVRAPGPVFSDALPFGPGGTDVVVVAVPITGASGELMGVLAGMFRLDAAAVNAFYGGIVRLRIKGSTTYLVDSFGKVVYHTDPGRIGQTLVDEPVVVRVLAGETSTLRTTDLDGRDILAAFAPVPNTPWGLVTEESWAALTSSGENYRPYLLILLALGIIVPAAVVLANMRRITRPIVDLTVAARGVAAGNFDQRIKVTSGDELAELADQFNLMSVRLQESYAHLERRVADRTKELAALNSIAAVVSQSLDLDEILQNALEKAVEVTRLETGAAFSLETKAHEGKVCPACLVCRAHQGFDEAIVRLIELLPYEGYPAAQAAERGGPIIWRIGEYPAGPLRTAMLEVGLQVAVSVPLVAKGEMLGVIELGTRTPRTFTSDELSLLVGIGQQVGLAVENARLYEKAEEVAATAERSRLARDLHDAVTQTLFSASLISEVLPKIWERNPEEARRRIEELRQLTRGALAEMRTLLLELRPAALADVPLGELLRQLCESTTGRARIPVGLEVEGQRSLPPDVKLGLYRISQEALNNVAKHSHASAATVSLRLLSTQPTVVGAPRLTSESQATPIACGEGVELCISDDGQGFDPDSVPANHLGLAIMRERAESIGATLSLDSDPDRGTEVWVVWRN